MIFVNFKTFGQGDAKKILDLVKIIEEVFSSTGVTITPVVQLIDASAAVNSTKLDVWVQRIGTSVEELINLGVKGTFLNHSDHRYEVWEELADVQRSCNGTNLKTMIFAGDIAGLGRALWLKPTFVAYEPPELIASSETSVSQAKPDDIKEAFILSQKAGIELIVGAGIKSKDDVKKSLELGAVGVAVSSAVTKAEDPRKILLDLTEGFK